MLSNKEKEYIKSLGTLYVKKNIGWCGDPNRSIYDPIDIIESINSFIYQEDLNNYMKYRNMKKYTKEFSCGGSSYMREDKYGDYVKVDSKYINLRDLQSKLKPEDIQREIIKFTNEHRNDIKFSWNPKVGEHGAYVPDPQGTFIYDKIEQVFINIKEE